MTRKRIKTIVAACGALVVLAVGVFGYAYYKAFRRFAEEDMVSGTYSPVIQALRVYKEENGTFPPSLEVLVPGYVPEIPSMPAILRVEYAASQSRDSCALRLYRHADSRVYLCVLGRDLNAVEEAKNIGGAHAFYVLRDDS